MNISKLKKRLTDPIESFAKLGDTISTEHGPLTYIDRGANVLAVAHLDFVYWNPRPKITKQYNNVKITKCPQLDDRLGAWMALDVLPRAGIKCDVLLTDSEEIGKSTAQFFDAPKDYNWIMQFDRAGSDVVMYDYEDQESVDILESYGYYVGVGAYTDICYLNHLGCKGFNFGVGYHDQHTKDCYANLSETFDSFRKVQDFYNDYKDTYLEHVEWEYVSNDDDLNIECMESSDWNDRFSTSDHPAADDVFRCRDMVSRDLYNKEYDWLTLAEREVVTDALASNFSRWSR